MSPSHLVTADTSLSSPSASASASAPTHLAADPSLPPRRTFVRALYDFDTDDPSCLPFCKHDVIEVLDTKHENGWWDGLLAGNRGWFPSNFVVLIDLGLKASPAPQPKKRLSVHTGLTRPKPDTARTPQVAQGGLSPPLQRTYRPSPSSSEFWIPKSTPKGEVFFVDLQTGQSASHLPQFQEEEEQSPVLDGSWAALTLAQADSDTDAPGPNTSAVDFDHLESDGEKVQQSPSRRRRNWSRKLADDGLTPYWVDRKGTVQWAPPSREASPTSPSHITSNGSTVPASNLTPSSRPSSSSASTHTQSLSPNSSFIHVSQASSSPHVRSLSPSFHSSNPVRSGTPTRLSSLLPVPPPSDLTILRQQAIAALQALSSFASSSPDSSPWTAEQCDQLQAHTVALTVALRELLYAFALPLGELPPSILSDSDEPSARTRALSRSADLHLKPAQRGVTAALSKLVLMARTVHPDRDLVPQTPADNVKDRLVAYSTDVERAIDRFVDTVRQRHETAGANAESRRVKGAFDSHDLGQPIDCGGHAIGKQIGRKQLTQEVVDNLTACAAQAEEQLWAFEESVQVVDLLALRLRAMRLIKELQAYVLQVASVDLSYVNLPSDDVTQGEDAPLPKQGFPRWSRELEVALQTATDESSNLLLLVQSPGLERSRLHATATTLRQAFVGMFECLLSEAREAVGLDSPLSVPPPLPPKDARSFPISTSDTERETDYTDADVTGDADSDVLDVEDALRRVPRLRTQVSQFSFRDPSFASTDPSFATAHDSDSYASDRDEEEPTPVQPPLTPRWDSANEVSVVVDPDSPAASPLSADDGAGFNFERLGMGSLGRRSIAPRSGTKLEWLAGEELPRHIRERNDAGSKPAYLRASTKPEELVLDVNGGIKGGTIEALVERLTYHEHADPTFANTFMLTYKSFMTMNELFDALVARFNEQPPDGLKPMDLTKWTQLKQRVVQVRVLNTMKSLLEPAEDFGSDPDDLAVLTNIRDFASKKPTATMPAAQQLLALVTRIESGNTNSRRLVINAQPPPSILPKVINRKLVPTDVDALELARQLTIMESQLYQNIRPMECLRRSREQRKAGEDDNISLAIKTTTRISHWLADAILSAAEPGKRMAMLRHFINVAYRCRQLNNYSSMWAIVSGLLRSHISRLERTWDLLDSRSLSRFRVCESLLKPDRNFDNYRKALHATDAPCVPFMGRFMSTLTFIQDGNPDLLPGQAKLINFSKRQRAADVVTQIQSWQSKPYVLRAIPLVQSYLRESLAQFGDEDLLSDYFWRLSLQREPREKAEDRVERVLTESGFA